MKKLLIIPALILSSMAFGQKYKALLQMKNYAGEGAYITAYIVNGKGQVIKTLSVMGDDKKWYKNLKYWYAAQKAKAENLDAITSASISGGKRNIFVVNIDPSLMNKGNAIRFESAVEHGNAVAKELEIPLSTAGVQNKVDGTGYIRFVKLNAV